MEMYPDMEPRLITECLHKVRDTFFVNQSSVDAGGFIDAVEDVRRLISRNGAINFLSSGEVGNLLSRPSPVRRQLSTPQASFSVCTPGRVTGRVRYGGEDDSSAETNRSRQEAAALPAVRAFATAMRSRPDRSGGSRATKFQSDEQGSEALAWRNSAGESKGGKGGNGTGWQPRLSAARPSRVANVRVDGLKC
mmetsp:Transcript_5313/g.11441  ORF Transcript_5313/g.11441 Transcript_5313/m.11441 type:complete len:193 (-) Transcript_5313:362-940(-)